MHATHRSVVLAVALALTAAARADAPRFSADKLVDLSHAFDETTIYWPNAPQTFHWEKESWGPTPAGYWYAAAHFTASEHGGTHVDSPIHFGEGRAAVDELPLARLMAPAVVIDITAACARERDYQLRPDDVLAWERAHGPLPAGAIALVRTDWSTRWPDKARYLGSAKPGDTTHLHFPGLSRAAAELLVQRHVAGVGIDTASIDPGPSTDFPAHRVLNGAGVYGLENLMLLERLPPVGATLIALPMKIKGGSGAPTRVVAVLP